MPTIILILLAILLPPLAVYLKTSSGKQTIINLLLCFLFWLPGVLHALYLVRVKAIGQGIRRFVIRLTA